MLVQCALLVLCLSCVRIENVYGDELSSRASFNRFSLWPSVHNAATLLRMKREAPVSSLETGVAGANEGTVVSEKPPDAAPVPPSPQPSKPTVDETNVPKTKASNSTLETTMKGNKTDATTVAPVSNTTALNITSTEKPKALDLNNPGVVKRGLIVFGGFALMAVAYFIFYKKKNQNNDMSNSLGMNDANQFRYGVLQNEDMKDNLESSRIPLTMESEDEVDEDLEIFDLVQKKKSLSYVNLQQNDEDVVLSPREDVEGDNLLLDIEDASSDTLINWSSTGSKSIL